MGNAGVQAPPQSNDIYRGVWRLHFIAGLIVIPFLLIMATTGGLYLFKDEINSLIYPDLLTVPASSAKPVPLSSVIADTERTLHGKVVWITPPASPGASISMMVHQDGGETLTAYADPYTGRMLGSTPFGGIMHLIRKIHSFQRFGFWASCLIEAVAGWAIIMVATGFFLWWPRGQKAGVVTVRGPASKRVFWRDLHAVTGAFAGLGIVFLAVTGLTWSMVWGVNVQMWVVRHQLYAPKAPGFTLPEEIMVGFRLPEAKVPPPAEKLPWSMERMPQPRSTVPPAASADTPAGPAKMDGMTADEHAAHMAMAGDMTQPAAVARTPIGIDAAYAKFRQLGLPPGFGIALPLGAAGIYAGNYFPQSTRGNHMMYLDQYSGKLLGQTRFSDYFVGGKVIEFGNNVHMGREFGGWNKAAMLLICLSIILLSVSSIAMWWKRRPKHRIGVPPTPADKRVMRGITGIAAIIGAIFPLTGITLVIGIVVQLVIDRSRRRMQAH